MTAASAACKARLAQKICAYPSLSPATPKSGDTRDPAYWSAPNTARSDTEPDSTSTYQPRINTSISLAHDIARSPPHWKRKLRTRKGANINL